jgi:hypothetical protein
MPIKWIWVIWVLIKFFPHGSYIREIVLIFNCWLSLYPDTLPPRTLYRRNV